MQTYIAYNGKSHIRIGRLDLQVELGATLPGEQSWCVLLLLDGDRVNELYAMFASWRGDDDQFHDGPAIRAFVAQSKGKQWRMPFFAWLQRQTKRKDHVGQFARAAVADPTFPRSARYLKAFRKYYDSKGTPCVSLRATHREWCVHAQRKPSA